MFEVDAMQVRLTRDILGADAGEIGTVVATNGYSHSMVVFEGSDKPVRVEIAAFEEI